MHVIAILFGLLLLLFGGGCTLIFLFSTIQDPRSMLADAAMILQIWAPLGLIPLVAGWFLFRFGLKRSREGNSSPAPPPGAGET
jgi:hypothetical protein